MTRQVTTLKPILCGPDGKCSGMCEQGKDCAGSVLASQAALGMHRFFTEEGGQQIDTEDELSSLPYLFFAGIVAFALVSWWMVSVNA